MLNRGPLGHYVKSRKSSLGLYISGGWCQITKYRDRGAKNRKKYINTLQSAEKNAK